MPTIETLPLLLKQLRLPTIAQQWESFAKKAQDENWTYPMYLSALMDIEATARHDARISRHLKQAHLPIDKSLDNFHFQAVPSVNTAQIIALSQSVEWVQAAENVIILGPSGVGKTHLAAAIGYGMIQKGKKVLFSSAMTLVQRLQLARSEFKLPQTIDKLARFDILILDDIAYLKNQDNQNTVLFELIAQRYENSSLIITANETFDQWDKIFPSETMAVAAIDRLVHHATIVNIRADSYRKKQSANKQAL